MSDATRIELQGRNEVPSENKQVPATAQTGSKNEVDVQTHGAHGKPSSKKELEVNPSKTSSTVSLERRSVVVDEEKGLPIDVEVEKQPTITDVERDPNVVDWGENDPENPLNWSPRKKWYTSQVQVEFVIYCFVPWGHVLHPDQALSRMKIPIL